MTSLIRKKHTFLYHGKSFQCMDLSLEDYLLLSIDELEGMKKILSECNEEMPLLNQRQSKEFVRILFGQEEEKVDILTETQKKIQAHKNKNKRTVKDDLVDILKDWHLIEWKMMYHLHQPLSEMRKWPYRYFMSQYEDLPITIGTKDYDKHRNSKKPDKRAFKKEFGDLYTKK